METELIRPMGEEYQEYLRDESRKAGWADSISFPRTAEEIAEVLRRMSAQGIPVTIQGGRTGLAAGACPRGGHIMNLSRMDRVLGCRRQGKTFYFTLQPGLPLASLRKMIAGRSFQTQGWSAQSLADYAEFCRAPAQFFAPDPTETSAALGGMTACNASGARSFYYGSMRQYISALQIILADGDSLRLRRGEQFAQGRRGLLTTEGGRQIQIPIPDYQMPAVKNASGYYVYDDMDLIDLFIGSDGTLGVIAEIEIRLVPLPPVVWGATAFFDREEQALRYVRLLRGEGEQGRALNLRPAAVEFFNGDALRILRKQRQSGGVFARLPAVPERYEAAIYAEIHSESEEEAMARLLGLGQAMELAGGREQDSWAARSQAELDRLMFFRHAIPESVNMLIDRRKKQDPAIAKLGTDMAAPDWALEQIMATYRRDLAEQGLESAIWGHIGDNHLHVNILPKDAGEYQRGQALYGRWAQAISEMGGAVSAEHGVGKLKRAFLQTMYGREAIEQMRELKRAFDPQWLLSPGNLFEAEQAEERK